MKVQIVRSVMVRGNRAETGEILDIPMADASMLLGMGAAVEPVEAPPACPPKPPVRKKAPKGEGSDA